MTIESKIPSRENPSPAQSALDAIGKPIRGERFEARETDTDNPNQEIAKPESDVVQRPSKNIP